MAPFTDRDFRRKFRRVAELEGVLPVTRGEPALTDRDFRRKWVEAAGLEGLIPQARLGPALTDEDFRRKFREAATTFGLNGLADLTHSVEFAQSNLTADDGFMRSSVGEALGVANVFTLVAWVKQTNLATGTNLRIVYGIGEDDATPFNNGVSFLRTSTDLRAIVHADDNVQDNVPSPATAADRFHTFDEFATTVNVWHLLGLSYDQGAGSLLYHVDGVLEVAQFVTGPFPVLNDAADRTLLLGGNPIQAGGSMPMRVASFGCWSRALSAAAQLDMYEGGAPNKNRDWRNLIGAGYTQTDADALLHWYRAASGTLSEFGTDLVGTLSLDQVNGTDGPTDSNMILDAP